MRARRLSLVAFTAAAVLLAGCSSAGPSSPGGVGSTGEGATGAGQTGAGQTGAGQTGAGQTGAGTGTTGAGGSPSSGSSGMTPVNKPRIFAYYYLWWSRKHWTDSLGPSYPANAPLLPLPATLDATGCNPTRAYPGVTVTDVPDRLYSQDDPGYIAADVKRAAAAGLAGFAVNWIGTGSATQKVADSQYTRRLQLMVDAVHAVNAAGGHFSLWLSYKASVNVLPTSQIIGDLTWFQRTYGSDPAFDRSMSSKPTVIWNGSRKYPVDVLSTVSTALRGSLRIIGDETTWSTDRAPYLDGDAYYWSSQNPYANKASFGQLGALATSVRATGANPDGSAKVFVAPLIPGYDKALIGGTSCVPRNGGATLRTIFAGNLAATHPDAWALISWNEITEGTYVTPMRRFGTQDLDAVTAIVSGTP